MYGVCLSVRSVRCACRPCPSPFCRRQAWFHGICYTHPEYVRAGGVRRRPRPAASMDPIPSPRPACLVHPSRTIPFLPLRLLRQVAALTERQFVCCLRARESVIFFLVLSLAARVRIALRLADGRVTEFLLVVPAGVGPAPTACFSKSKPSAKSRGAVGAAVACTCGALAELHKRLEAARRVDPTKKSLGRISHALDCPRSRAKTKKHIQ